MKYNEFTDPREKPQVRPVTTMDPKELDARIEKAKAKAFKKPDPIDITKLWTKEKPATEDAMTSADVDRIRNQSFSDKQIKMAFGILNDPRYRGGNYTAAYNIINRIAPGLADHPDVANALRRANEMQEDITTLASRTIRNYAREIGPDSMDYGMFMKSAELLDKGMLKSLAQLIDKSDTAPREYVMKKIADHDPETFKKMYGDQEGYLSVMKPIGMEGFIGKKPDYTDFLQNKLDSAVKEYDSPEKKAERDALMKKYLAKGGKVEKVPTGKTAYKGKELKPAYKKDTAGTPITSPMSDESVEEDEPGYYKNPDKEFNINGMTTKQDVVQSIIDNIDNNELDTAKDSLNQLLDVVTALHEDAPFDGMGLVRMALMRKFITAQEWHGLQHKWKDAVEELEQRYDDWPEDQGFGSSDHAYAIKELMELVGYEFDDQDTSGRFVVSKMPPELEKLGIKNARMKGEPVATEARGDHRKIMLAIQNLQQMIIDAKISDDEKESAMTSLDQIQQDVSGIQEGGMPASIIKHKQKLAHMSDEELADRFKDFDEQRLRQMAWRHGYGKMSSHYLDRVKNHMTSKRTGTTEEMGPGFAVRYSLDGERKVQAYKTEKDAQHRAKILRSMGGVKDVSVTKHTLNFKKESIYESKLVRMLNQRLK